jgi:WD40 repeat protein
MEEIRLWDRATGACSRTWTADDEVTDLAFAPDGSWLVTGGADGGVRIWDAKSGTERLAGSRPPLGIENLTVSADGTLAVSSLRTEAWVWDTATGTCRQRVARAGLSTTASATLPDGRVLSDWGSDAGGWWQGGATLWDPQSGKDLASLDGTTDYGTRIAVDPKGRWAVATSWDSDVYVWDLGSGRLVRTLKGGPSHFAVAISPDGARIAAASKNLFTQATGLLVWGPDGDAPVARIDGPPQANAICFSPDGARLAGGSVDGTVHLRAAKDLAEVAVLRGHDGEVTSVTWSVDGRWILSGGKDGTVRVWDAATGKEADLIAVDGGPLALALRKDRLYVGCANRTVCVYAWQPPE